MRGSVRIAIVALVAAVALFAFRAPIGRASLCAVLDVVTGDRIAFAHAVFSPRRIALWNLTVARGGDPLVAADRLDVRYDLHALVFGGERRYGLARVTLDRPRVTLVRHADGSFAYGPGSAAGPGRADGKAHDARAPLRFALAVRDGSVELVDPGRALAVARDLRVTDVNATAVVDGAARTTYRGSARVAGDPRQAISFAGRIDVDGFASHRLRASRVDLPPIVDYFINAPSAAFVRGTATALELRAYAFPAAHGRSAYHIAGTATVVDGRMHVPGLRVDATGMRGTISAYDDGLVSSRLDARLGALPVRLAGGLYDWTTPSFRLGITSQTDLAAARSLFRFSRRLPLRGPASLATLLEGSVGEPLVATRVASPGLTYGRFPVTGAAGRAIFYADAVDVVGAHGRYGDLDVGVDGTIALGTSVATQLVARARGPAAGVPYAAQIAPGATLTATGLLSGAGIAFDARGLAEGDGGGVTMRAPFHIDARGDGIFGPIVARRGDGSSLAGAYYLDRAESTSGFWLDARAYDVADLGTRPRLPGIELTAPPFAGTLDGAMAGVGPPSAFRLAGRIRVRALRVGSVAIDDVSGDVAGAFGNLRLGAVSARGPWGRFAGGGAYAGGRLALAGTYGGSFERLRTFTGDLGATGALAGPVTLLLDPQRTLVQTPGAASDGARVRGIPVDRVAGTLAVAGRRLQIFAATADVSGGRLAAAGTLGGTAGIGVSVFGADAGRMRGTPLAGGSVAAIGRVSNAAGRTSFRGGLAIAGGTTGRLAVAGNGDLTFAPGLLDIRAGDGQAGAAYAAFGGRIDRVGTSEAAYDLAVHVPALAIGPLASAFAPPRDAVAGTLAGEVHIRGELARLRVTGDVRMPEGTVSGLAFQDASARISIDPGGIRASGGRVTVGSTATTFAALYRGNDSAIRVESPRADLSDFNDYFDAGDTLGGRGRVSVRFSKHGTVTQTDADIAIASLRFRRFDLGDATAVWTSHGRNVTGSVDFGGRSGHLAASGVLVLPQHARLEGLLRRSQFDGTANLAGLDLGVWLPALGYQVPVGGRVDAIAKIRGSLQDPAVTTVATLRDGSIGKYPVDRLSISAMSTLDRTTIRNIDLELPSVSVIGTGQFGLAPRAPLALSLRATSPNLGILSTRLFGVSYPLTGSGDATLSVDGTRESPRITGRVDVRDATVRGVALPQAGAGFTLRGRDVVLRDALVRFANGSLTLGGSVPLEIAPFALGPPSARVALDFAANDVELSNFAPLLPPGSQLQGRIDGNVTVGGSAGAPQLGGLLTLANGTFASPLETVPLTEGTARLRFDGDAARLDAFHAAAGGGTIDASGSARFADLIAPGSAVAYDFVGRADKLRLDVPAYGSGIVDGTLSFARLAGGPPKVAGDLRLSDGVIPFSALLLAGGGSGGGGFDASGAVAGTPAVVAVPHDVAFNLDVSAVRNVRVRSANVDIGAKGDLHVDGSLDRPVLSGGFTSTGGTITYFNTVFRLTDGKVTFQPDAGVIPTLSAVAITHVIDPDPNTLRNVAGTADVTLTLMGPVTNLTIGLKSDPAYERQQILGLLLNAPALGASNLFAERGEATLYGSNGTANQASGVPATRLQSGDVSVAQEAFGIANAQFTRALLSPIETSFAQAVGLSNFDVNVDYTGNVGLSARKVLGKNVNAIYGTSFGYPYRQTFGFDVKQSETTAAQVTVFETLGENGLSSLTPTTFITSTSNPKYNAAQPSGGTVGFSLSLQHLF